MKNKKNNIYKAHTGVDPEMSNMDDASCWRTNHSSRVLISHTASVEWNIISPYAASRKIRP